MLTGYAVLRTIVASASIGESYVSKDKDCRGRGIFYDLGRCGNGRELPDANGCGDGDRRSDLQRYLAGDICVCRCQR
jgi:hypothetical protein